MARRGGVGDPGASRLPPPHRVEPLAVYGYLADVAASDFLTLDARWHRGLIDHLAKHRVTGGAPCDALVGWTVQADGVDSNTTRAALLT